MKIAIIGIGMGNPDTLTLRADKLLREAELIIGAGRILESLNEDYTSQRLAEIYPEKINNIIEGTEAEKIAIVMSGDTGFYSGASKLINYLEKYDLEVLAGISSMQYLASKLKRPWQNFKLVSAHGKDCNVIGQVVSNEEVFFLTGGQIMAHDIVDMLCNHGLDDVMIHVGQKLSYDDEIIISDYAKNLLGKKFESLAVVLVENPSIYRKKYAGNMADRDFIRAEVPMTKRDVRGAIVARLNIKNDDIIYDIGAGTGSCSIEMALLNRTSKIYAVEINDDAYELIKKNIIKFSAHNVKAIYGKAPQALIDLPKPNAAFIGGSKKNMEAIVDLLVQKNRDVKIVVSAVTYETLIEAINTLKKFKFNNVDITQIAVTNTRQVGSYNMLMAQNPVFIVSGEGVKYE